MLSKEAHFAQKTQRLNHPIKEAREQTCTEAENNSRISSLIFFWPSHSRERPAPEDPVPVHAHKETKLCLDNQNIYIWASSMIYCGKDAIVGWMTFGRWKEYFGFVSAYKIANRSNIGDVAPPLNRRASIRMIGSLVRKQLIVKRPIFAANEPDFSSLLKVRRDPLRNERWFIQCYYGNKSTHIIR